MQNQIEINAIERELLAVLEDVGGAITWDTARTVLCAELLDSVKPEVLARVFNLYALRHMQASYDTRAALLTCAGPMQ